MFDFDEVVDRKGTNCAKWDTIEANNKPKDVLPMWVADMDFKSPKEIENALVKRIRQGVYGYSFAPDEYFDAVISWMKRRHDFDIKKEWIVPTPGVVTAIKLCVNAYTKENDAIIINKPVYYPFDFSIELNHRRIIENEMVYKENSYEMDYVAFEKAIVENDVRMFILCNPYNPIGKVWKEDELKQIGEICKKHHVLVIVDEIHEDFVYGDHIHIPFYNVDESYKEFSVVLTAPSKTFNLAGLQTSNIIIADEKLRKAYQETMNRYGVNEPNFLGIIACMTAYNECELWVDEMLEYVYKITKMDFRDNMELRMALNQHMVPLLVRVKYNIPLKNPERLQIKSEYSLAYTLAATATTVINAKYHTDLNEDEICYLAIHFALAQEKIGHKIQKKNILIVCVSGKGSSQLFMYRYKEAFGKYIKHIYESTVYNLKNFDFKKNKIDYVFTTVPIEFNIPVPVFRVSLFLNRTEINTYSNMFEMGDINFLKKYIMCL